MEDESVKKISPNLKVVDWVDLTDELISYDAAIQFLHDPRAGGIDVFLGTTRQWTGEKETAELRYECYAPMAKKEMTALLQTARSRWDIIKACMLHRLGVVPVAEASVLIGVSTPHRDDAFKACRYLIDRLKVQVPIWKREFYTDGSTEWVQGSMPPQVD